MLGVSTGGRISELLSLQIGTYGRMTGQFTEKEAIETLLLELALRRYDLSKPLRENETTAEIIKLG